MSLSFEYPGLLPPHHKGWNSLLNSGKSLLGGKNWHAYKDLLVEGKSSEGGLQNFRS